MDMSMKFLYTYTQIIIRYDDLISYRRHVCGCDQPVYQLFWD